MKLYFCGGAHEIGASCVLVELAGKRLLLDCGMRMKGDSLPDLQSVKRAGGVDAILLSHAHMDHSGNLPVISSEYPMAHLLMTPPTADLIRILLADSLKIMANEGEIPVFDRKQVDAMLERVLTHGWETSFKPFTDSDITVTFYQAGHILGAAAIYIESPEGSLFYSGDFSVGVQRTVGGIRVPSLQPTVCIVESTYGNRLHTSRDIEYNRLIEMASATVGNGGKLLIPAFAVGRAQEVILVLRAAMNKGQLPQVPIYIDGMVREVCRTYRKHPNSLREPLAKRIWKGHDPFFSDTVLAVNNAQERLQIAESTDPCIIVSSSGMLSGGASVFYAEKLATQPNAFIAITGYQDEESPGRQLQDLFNQEGERRWTVGGKEIPLMCGSGTYGLSAHADKTEILGLIDRLRPQRVYFVHGDDSALQELGDATQQKIRGRVYLPTNGSSYYVDSRCGTRRVKELPPSLGNSSMPDGDDFKSLSEHLKDSSRSGPWSVAELLAVWGYDSVLDADAEADVMTRLNESPWFTHDTGRLFLFHPVTDAPVVTAGGAWEVNRMLARAAELFPPETGLYRKGARIESHTARLLFRFPAVAKTTYADRLALFTAETGWATEVNDQPDTSSLHPLLTQLLARQQGSLKKVAWFLDRHAVEATLTADPLDPDGLKQQFNETTGLQLELVTPSGAESVVSTAPLQGDAPVKPLVDRQKALAMVEEVFAYEPVEIYKTRVKTDAMGQFIELQFLTPAIGERYVSYLKGLIEETGWRIVWSLNPRQQELITLAQSLLAPHQLMVTKGPGIHTGERRATVKLQALPNEEILNDIRTQFLDKTGYSLIIQ